VDQTRTLKERARLDHGKPSEDFLLVKGKMASKNVEEVDIPQWSGIHDYLTIYRRKQPLIV
jgi:hypothetical protein